MRASQAQAQSEWYYIITDSSRQKMGRGAFFGASAQAVMRRADRGCGSDALLRQVWWGYTGERDLIVLDACL